MTPKTEQLWEISREQEKKLIEALPVELVERMEVKELFKMIRCAEYRRGKEEKLEGDKMTKTIKEEIIRIKDNCENWVDNADRTLCSECCREIKGLLKGARLQKAEGRKEALEEVRKELVKRYSTEPNLRIDIRDWEFIKELEGKGK